MTKTPLTRTPWLLIVVLLLAGPAPAQEAADPTAEFLAGLTDFDARLAGTYSFKMLMQDQELGTAELVVERAPEGSGAVYRASFMAQMAMGPMGFSGKEVALLDARLALVSAEITEKQTNPEGTTVKIARVTRGDAGWTRTLQSGDETQTWSAALDGPYHWGPVVGLLLCRKLAAEPNGVYVFRGIDWPDPEKDGPDAEPEVKAVKVTVKDPVTRTHRGEEMQLREILTVSDETMKAYVADDSRVIEFVPADAPIRIVAAGFEPAKTESAGTTDAGGGAESPRAAVAVFIHVLAGTTKPEALGPVMDWKALQEQMGANDPDVRALPLETFQAEATAEFGKQAGVITAEQADTIVPFLAIEETGDTATVTIPGQDGNPFRLRKVGGRWLITRTPQ